jgi:hypothetical protein
MKDVMTMIQMVNYHSNAVTKTKELLDTDYSVHERPPHDFYFSNLSIVLLS